MSTENKNNNSLEKVWKLVNFCEFDKYAAASYCAIHNVDDSLNLGDITKVDEARLESFNMICGGSPCQDFSVAGKQKGAVWTCADCHHEYNPLIVHWTERDKCPRCKSTNVEKTRSSLLVEYLRVIRANRPNFGIYENVKNIVGKQFKDTFKMFTDELNEYGYAVYWKVLNAKNYGIPQNRERVYVIFIRKDLDNGKFKFPESFDNGVRLKDVLEDEVDEKFYISDDKVQKFLKNFSSNLDTVTTRNSNITNCIRSSYYKNGSRNIMQNIENGGGYEGIVEHKEVTDVPIRLGNVYGGQFDTGYAGDSPTEQRLEFNTQGTTNTLTSVQKDNYVFEPTIEKIRIRKLTPKECFRLQGFSDGNFEAAEKMVSNSQLYKQAGNSIVVDVLYYIFVELYKAMPYLFEDLRLSSFFSGIGAFEVALDRLYTNINSGVIIN